MLQMRNEGAIEKQCQISQRTLRGLCASTASPLSLFIQLLCALQEHTSRALLSLLKTLKRCHCNLTSFLLLVNRSLCHSAHIVDAQCTMTNGDATALLRRCKDFTACILAFCIFPGFEDTVLAWYDRKFNVISTVNVTSKIY